MSEALALASFDGSAWLWSLLWVLLFAISGWALSLVRRDVSHVDSMWSLMFLVTLVVYTACAESVGWRATLVFTLVALWALRLSGYITWRNHGQPEDHRYQAIRINNQPNFEFKSLYLIFGLQGVLAWIICLPALAAVSGQTPLGVFDVAGVLLWLIGMTFETIGDTQLARFRARRSSSEVLNTGLWRYTRHPNYFGEFVLWWGIYLVAFGAGGGWTVFSPALMSFLLLRVSGVRLLEKDISERRPGYRAYVNSTNAFFPGRPRGSTENFSKVAK